MGEDIGKLFDEVAGGYDERLRRTVPCSEELYGVVLGFIPAERCGDLGGTLRVLDLGSGTGIFAAMVGKVFPEAKITLVDLSKEMMTLAENRLADEPDGKFTFHVMDYVNEDLSGKYDAVVSTLSLHHVPDEAKRKVFRSVYRLLEEGGVFVNADQFHRLEAGNEGRYNRSHQDHRREAGDGADHRPKTHESPLEDHLVWMREAGFTAVERAYENGRFAVYAGRKKAA